MTPDLISKNWYFHKDGFGLEIKCISAGDVSNSFNLSVDHKFGPWRWSLYIVPQSRVFTTWYKQAHQKDARAVINQSFPNLYDGCSYISEEKFGCTFSLPAALSTSYIHEHPPREVIRCLHEVTLNAIMLLDKLESQPCQH